MKDSLKKLKRTLASKKPPLPKKKKKAKKPGKKALKKTLPSYKQWKQFFRVLNHKERGVFLLLAILAVGSAASLGVNCYFKNTVLVPTYGGEYREGMVGQPMSLNPLRLSNQDVDRDLVEVLFSGLLKYDGNGNLVKDMAESYEIAEDGKSVEVYLRSDILWHDGVRLTIDDVMFTLGLIQDPQYQSPWRIKFLSIAADEISGGGVRFTLPKKYAGFLENLTFKILPKHIFKDIAPQSWPRLISKEYLVGSGPFKIKEIIQDKAGYIKSMGLERNEDYYAKKPYLEKLTFVFYKTSEDLLRAAKLGEVQGFSPTDLKAFLAIKNHFKTYLISIPRYFALFFNTKEKTVFEDRDIKRALVLALNKEALISDVFASKGKPVTSPILPGFFNFQEPSDPIQYNKEEAERILEEKGFLLNKETNRREKTLVKESTFKFTKNLTLESQGQDVTELQKCLAKDKEVYPEGVVSGYFGIKTKVAVIKFQEKYREDILVPAGLAQGNGEVKPLTREKLNQLCFQKQTEIIPLELTITTSDKFPLVEIAQYLKEAWWAIGVEVTVNKVSLAGLQTEVLANRNFRALLFGEALSSIPDPFPFWHSSQSDHPGLNISSYNSKKADSLLEKARESATDQERKESLEEFQGVFLEDPPALFLVRPDYTYMLSGAIQGYDVKKITEPSKRFSTLCEWSIETKRTWQ